MTGCGDAVDYVGEMNSTIEFQRNAVDNVGRRSSRNRSYTDI